MANEENLNKPWEKGQSGNPKGKPKGAKNRSTIARKWLEVLSKQKNPLTDELEDLSYEDLITLAQIKKAQENADTNAYKSIMDSAYGSPKETIEQTTVDKTPPKIEWTDTEEDEAE